MGYWIYLLTTCFLLCVISDDHKGDMQKKKCKFDEQHKSVDCSHQSLSEIPNSTFPSDAGKIDLSYNSITSVNNFAFTGVRQLKVLDLSYNQIRHLEPQAFQALGRLELLNLNSNAFKLSPEIFSPTLFGPLVNLSTLRLQMFSPTSSSVWKGIDNGFAMLTNLQQLFMDIPKDFVFGEGFAKLTKLQVLSTAGRPSEGWGVCKATRLTNETFNIFANTSIIELRLTSCNIESLEIGTFLALRNLLILDLSDNNKLGLRQALKSLYGLQHRNMTEINFCELNGAFVSAKNFLLCGNDTIYLKTICVNSIDFSKNYLYFSRDMCELPSFGEPICLETLKFFFRAMHYVPQNFYILVFEKYTSIKYADLSNGFSGNKYKQSRPPFTALDRRIDHLTGRQLYSTTHYGMSAIPRYKLPPTLLTLNISSILIGVFLDHWPLPINIVGSNLQTLDLSYNGIIHCKVTFKGLETLIQLDLSGLKCDKLSNILTTFPKLQRLKLRETLSLFRDIGEFDGDGNGFHALHDLQQIDLSGNKLTNVQKTLFINNTYLRDISLSNNKLQRVPLAIMQLPNISQLDLSVNAFTHLNAEEMSVFDHFNTLQSRQTGFRLSMGSNPFACTCETLKFIRWVHTTEVHLDHAGNYTCALPNGSRVDMAGFKSRIKDFSVSCISHTWLIIAVVSILFLALVIPLIYVVYRYRVHLRYWLYTKLTPPTEFLIQREYMYDVFAAYCEDNYQWVRDDLCKTLEHGEKDLKLCVHNRDFTPGKPIHENIVDKMRQSRKIILVISVEFLSSTYGPLEIEYAGMKCLEEGREDLIICILLEDIPVRDMPKPLRNLWHKITFLKFPQGQREQPHFWKQLREAIINAQ